METAFHSSLSNCNANNTIKSTHKCPISWIDSNHPTDKYKCLPVVKNFRLQTACTRVCLSPGYSLCMCAWKIPSTMKCWCSEKDTLPFRLHGHERLEHTNLSLATCTHAGKYHVRTHIHTLCVKSSDCMMVLILGLHVLHYKRGCQTPSLVGRSLLIVLVTRFNLNEKHTLLPSLCAGASLNCMQLNRQPPRIRSNFQRSTRRWVMHDFFPLFLPSLWRQIGVQQLSITPTPDPVTDSLPRSSNRFFCVLKWLSFAEHRLCVARQGKGMDQGCNK
jgi:hypothetical protein